MNNKLQPVFIHSLFRSGSTYLFNVFRRSTAGYTTYEEPLNPELIFMAANPEKILTHHRETSKLLRHPKIDKPYFYEFYLLVEKVGRLFRKEFSYDQYFVSDTDDISELKTYLSALIEGSPGRPVFQCCRSTGRVKRCRTECGGMHIFLWRNPWDQWWSYRIGFDTHNLLIVNAANPPAYLKQLKQNLGLPEFHHSDVFQEYAYYKKYPMDSRQSYTLFYALWCHAILEAMPYCDISINIDRLSNSSEYKENILSQLELHGIHGLDFSDCEIPQGIYGKSDSDFFSEIEKNVHDLLMIAGYSQHSVEKMQQIRSENSPVSEPVKARETAVRDASRAREIVRYYENRLHEEYLSDKEYVLALLEKDAECYRLNIRLQESESDRAARMDQIKQYDIWLKESQAEVKNFKNSLIYKIGKRLGIL